MSDFSSAFNSASSASYGQSSTQLPPPFPSAGSTSVPAPVAIPPGGANDGKNVTLSNGQRIDLAEARLFMDFYCKSCFPSPHCCLRLLTLARAVRLRVLT